MKSRFVIITYRIILWAFPPLQALAFPFVTPLTIAELISASKLGYLQQVPPAQAAQWQSRPKNWLVHGQERGATRSQLVTDVAEQFVLDKGLLMQAITTNTPWHNPAFSHLASSQPYQEFIRQLNQGYEGNSGNELGKSVKVFANLGTIFENTVAGMSPEEFLGEAFIRQARTRYLSSPAGTLSDHVKIPLFDNGHVSVIAFLWHNVFEHAPDPNELVPIHQHAVACAACNLGEPMTQGIFSMGNNGRLYRTRVEQILAGQWMADNVARASAKKDGNSLYDPITRSGATDHLSHTLINLGPGDYSVTCHVYDNSLFGHYKTPLLNANFAFGAIPHPNDYKEPKELSYPQDIACSTGRINLF